MLQNPYVRLMRLDKPVGIWLVLCPALWGVLMAQPSAPNPGLLFTMLIGAVLMRSAGCIINDLTDRDLDGAVARTAARPLVSGEVTVREAYILLGALLLAALGLCFVLPQNVLLLGLIALPLIAAYPWMKRFTWWPQAFLGITFNLGVLIGWVATGTPLTPASFILYLGCIAWTLGYDTIYAMQDMEDDALIGIRSTARRLGERIPAFVSGCYTMMLACLLVSAGMAKMGPLALLGALGATYFAYRQVRVLQKPHAKVGASALFRANQWLGLWLFFCLLTDRYIFHA